jgi:hypothetical protein
MLLRILTGTALIVVLMVAVIGSYGGGADAASPTPMTHSMAKPSASSTPAPKPDQAEAAYIADVTKVLQERYPTTGAASAAGYYQMTRLEDDGTVIWFNNKWDDEVAKYKPNFLWFDKSGKLVGLDYQYLASTHPKPPGPGVYPVMGIRWTTIDAHLQQNVDLLKAILGAKARFQFVRLPGDGRTFVGDVKEAVRITQAPHVSWDAELVPVGEWNKRADLKPWPLLSTVKSTADYDAGEEKYGTEGLSPGDRAILLLHDAHWEGKRELLKSLLQKMQEQGYVFDSLGDVPRDHKGIDWPVRD